MSTAGNFIRSSHTLEAVIQVQCMGKNRCYCWWSEQRGTDSQVSAELLKASQCQPALPTAQVSTCQSCQIASCKCLSLQESRTRQPSLLFQHKCIHLYLSCQPVSKAAESCSLIICSGCCSLFLMKYFGVALAAQTSVNKRLLSKQPCQLNGEDLHTTLKQSEEHTHWNTREPKLCCFLLFQSLLFPLAIKILFLPESTSDLSFHFLFLSLILFTTSPIPSLDIYFASPSSSSQKLSRLQFIRFSHY